MAFSQQSYQGQGIATQNVTPRGGEIIGAALADVGQSYADYKRMSGASKGMRMTLQELGLLSKEQADSMGFYQLLEASKNAPALMQQMTEEQQAGLLSEYLEMQKPQTVAEPAVTNQMIDAARQKVSQADMDYSRSLPPVSDPAAQESGPSQSFLQQVAPQTTESEPSMLKEIGKAFMPGGEDGGPGYIEQAARIFASPQVEITKAAARLQDNLEQRAKEKPEASKTKQEADSAKLLSNLQEAQRELDILEVRMAEDDFNLRPETVAEVNERFAGSLSELIKKYPKAAGLAYQLAVKPGEAAEPLELNESERKAYQFGTGMMEESKTIDRIESSAAPESFIGWIQGKAPNFAQTEDFQNYEAAKRRWAEFNLRALTGAEARESEVERNVANFFPQPGDSPATIKAKREARQNRMQSIMFAVPGAPQSSNQDLDYDPSSKSFR
jgi:hypothetical protein